MSGKAYYIMSYDIRDPKRLRRVAKKMEGNGERIQYSTFRCHLTARELERLRWELVKVMEAEDDLLVIPLCNSCVARCRVDNPEMSWPEREPSYRIL